MSNVPFKSADILIPENADMNKWSVVACDQYTSEPEYWEKVEKYVGSNPSTLNMIYPEVYLESGGDERITSINNTMDKYIEDDIFKCYANSMIYVERTVLDGKVRKGIVGAVDLEHYDYHKGSKSLIRATEGTVLERIPPRVKVRINAKLELPHIMLLIDDEKDIVFKSVNKLEKVYDFDLMCNSGHITGYTIDTNAVSQKLEELYNATKSDNHMLFAVGDGNHSLATAKECWEQIKATLSDSEKETHPARYALVELVNIHDSALEFEPIHRVVFNCNPGKLIEDMKKYYPKANTEGDGQKITYVYGDVKGDIYIPDAPSELTVGTLQMFLDEYLKASAAKIDYIHGDDVTVNLSKQDNAIGFLLPAMEKSQLFKTVVADGALPRKTFSMGEAWEKRFYLEARKVR